MAGVRAEGGAEAGLGDVQRGAARHRRRLHHGVRRDRRRHRRDAPPRRLETLRSAPRGRRTCPPAARPGRVARGTARRRHADDRLREPDLQVLRVVAGQRLRGSASALATNVTLGLARSRVYVCICVCVRTLMSSRWHTV